MEMIEAKEHPRASMTRQAFENAIIVLMALGGSRNGLLIAIAGKLGMRPILDDFDCSSELRPSERLLVPQRHHRVQPRRLARGPIDRPHRDHCKQRRHGSERDRIVGLRLIKQVAKHTGPHQRSAQSQ